MTNSKAGAPRWSRACPRSAGPAARHPGRKRALKLLNDTFRKSKLPQRLAVLQAAAWLIDVLEKLNTIT